VLSAPNLIRHITCAEANIRSRAALLALVLAVLSPGCPPKDEVTDSSAETRSSETSPGPSTTPVTPTSGGSPEVCEMLPAVDEGLFPETIADVICTRKAECECTEMTDGECRERVIAYFDKVRSDAALNDLVFNGACVSQRLQEFAETGCNRAGFDQFLERGSCGGCYFYTGSTVSGVACEAPRYPIVNECATVGEECRSPGPSCLLTVGAGKPCFGVRDCDPGLACDLYHVCTKAGVGDPCLDKNFFWECSLGLRCDAGICREPKAVGAPCSNSVQCETSRCEAGVCVDYLFACDFHEYDF